MCTAVFPAFTTELSIQLRALEPHSLHSPKGFLIPEFMFQCYRHATSQPRFWALYTPQCSRYRRAFVQRYFAHTLLTLIVLPAAVLTLRQGMSLRGSPWCQLDWKLCECHVNVMCTCMYCICRDYLMRSGSMRRSYGAILCITRLDHRAMGWICSF